jgi:hypothetical protein
MANEFWSFGVPVYAIPTDSFFGGVATQGVLDRMRIPMKVVSDFDLIPVTGSEVKPIIFGAKRR